MHILRYLVFFVYGIFWFTACVEPESVKLIACESG